MFSREQEIERLNRIKTIMGVIWQSSSIKEIHEKTKISTSSIQRYLNNDKLLKEAGFTNEDILEVKKWLLNSKLNGLSRGGKKTQTKYGDSYTRIADGKFSGIANSGRKK